MDIPEHMPEHEVEDPSGLVAKLRALLRGNSTAQKVETRSEAAADFRTRVFGSATFFRLWLAQAITSLGDWLGFLAILTLAARIGADAGNPGTSVGLVVAARIVPGFFFSAAAGVLVDRMDRKQVMVVTTLMRAMVVAALPFIGTLLELVLVSLVLEVATLMTSSAKEATVPNLVPADRLASANSLGLAAAYGTFPLASLLFAFLAMVASWLGTISALDALRTSQEAVAFYAAVVCYLIAAFMISRLAIPKDHVRMHEQESVDLGRVFTEIKEGWHYVFLNPVVRAVNLGLATGLVGGGMLIPLGQIFSDEILGAGTSGYGMFITSLGLGVGVGIIGVSVRQNSINKPRAFVASVFGAGVTLLIGASMSTLALAALAIGVVGIFAGRVYVLGFTLLHENVDDELRGRVFAGLYTLVRLCVLLSMVIGPMLQDVLDRVSNTLVGREIELGVAIAVPGVRLTLWFAGLIMLGAAALAAGSLRQAQVSARPRRTALL